MVCSNYSELTIREKSDDLKKMGRLVNLNFRSQGLDVPSGTAVSSLKASPPNYKVRWIIQNGFVGLKSIGYQWTKIHPLDEVASGWTWIKVLMRKHSEVKNCELLKMSALKSTNTPDVRYTVKNCSCSEAASGINKSIFQSKTTFFPSNICLAV